jgi:pyruvate/2-oxoglutarate dehydrogenase complex dihydrolipoamide acyltransferase (E2) component
MYEPGIQKLILYQQAWYCSSLQLTPQSMSSRARAAKFQKIAKMEAATQRQVQKTNPNEGFKTKICSFFQNGCCRNGDACAFAHGEEDLRITYKPSAQYPSKFKTQLCMYWSAGKCRNGSSCSFAHGQAELRAVGEEHPVAEERSVIEEHPVPRNIVPTKADFPPLGGSIAMTNSWWSVEDEEEAAPEAEVEEAAPEAEVEEAAPEAEVEEAAPEAEVEEAALEAEVEEAAPEAEVEETAPEAEVEEAAPEAEVEEAAPEAEVEAVADVPFQYPMAPYYLMAPQYYPMAPQYYPMAPQYYPMAPQYYPMAPQPSMAPPMDKERLRTLLNLVLKAASANQ